jgi:hypothetical protein
MSILRKRIIHKPENYYKDSVRLSQGRYHGWNDQWDGGPRQGWTDAYNGHSSRLSITEQRDALIEDFIIDNQQLGKTLTKTNYVCDDFVVEDSTDEELWDSDSSEDDNNEEESEGELEDSKDLTDEELWDSEEDSEEDSEDEFEDSDDSDSEEEFEEIELDDF